MILGMSTAAFTTFHVILSLIGIVAGILVTLTMCNGRHLARMAAIFLITTVATSLTGFLFHSAKIGPPHFVGVISLVILAIAIYAHYGKHLAGRWRRVYVVTAVWALYFNCFVGVVQAFQKLRFLRPLAPTQSEPPFIIAQVLVLGLFVAITVIALKRFSGRTTQAIT